MEQLELLIDNVCGSVVTVRENGDLSAYSGETVAFDATNGLYYFLDIIRQQTPEWLAKYQRVNMHLVGALITTVRMLENKINPVYIFSGKPSPLRTELLWEKYKKQLLKENKNETDLKKFQDFYHRINILGKRNELECRQLFKLLGIPILVAPGEAGPQCAEMIRSGKAFASVSQDLNALTFGAKVLLKNIVFPPIHDLPVEEFHLQQILNSLQLKQSQLIELAILLGCDYCEGIRGVGRKQVLKLVQQHQSIENVLHYESTENRFIVPENWKYLEVRELFTNPEVADSSQLKIKRTNPNIDHVINYLVKKHSCDEIGILNILKRVW